MVSLLIRLKTVLTATLKTPALKNEGKNQYTNGPPNVFQLVWVHQRVDTVIDRHTHTQGKRCRPLKSRPRRTFPQGIRNRLFGLALDPIAQSQP